MFSGVVRNSYGLVSHLFAGLFNDVFASRLMTTVRSLLERAPFPFHLRAILHPPARMFLP